MNFGGRLVLALDWIFGVFRIYLNDLLFVAVFNTLTFTYCTFYKYTVHLFLTDNLIGYLMPCV